MPLLHFKSTGRCGLCGCRLRGGGVQQFRINKKTLVGADRGGLFFEDRSCPECGFESVGAPRPMVLTADSLAVVNEFRARKGWSQLRQ